ncbi:type II secretion system F family protein [Rathayibacter sp. ZW T2_19]|uniref:Type II secretion system F family protein n=1 Tax=Rathayibacter rubneri TaxID=2950106 RepID=A0A9X2DZD8_9MICO|nr:type II secretion system F family protein [Rathayibacter rubneri]MCM6761614.1 type II secretion system F family protein [Rathayibacter rubneri]
MLIASLCLLTALPLLFAALAPVGGERTAARRNLMQGLVQEAADTRSAADRLERIARRLLLPGALRRLDRLHAHAGRPAAWPLARVILAKPLLALVAAGAAALVITRQPPPILVLVLVAIVAVAYFVPDLLLHSRGLERQAAIALELPDTLDQMLIAVEAGLGFEAAMARAGDNGKGPLAEELVRTLQDMRVGMTRRDAYRALELRTSVPDLRSFVRAIVQADVYGVSVSGVLRTQAKEMRLKRRMRAEEKAMKIPVNILFPLMLFILPVLFIAVLGPTVISIITM